MAGYSHDKDEHRKRMRRIEGQVRGIAQMIEEDRYCIDVLTQVAAVDKALKAVAVGLLEEHLSHCVRGALEEGASDVDEKVAEAVAAVRRLVRS